jgi:hypothetical protein
LIDNREIIRDVKFKELDRYYLNDGIDVVILLRVLLVLLVTDDLGNGMSSSPSLSMTSPTTSEVGE